MTLAACVCLCLAFAAPARAVTSSFTASELLGRPTDTSVSIKIVPASAIQYRYEYGTEPGVYTGQTGVVNASAGPPSEATIHGPQPEHEVLLPHDLRR